MRGENTGARGTESAAHPDEGTKVKKLIIFLIVFVLIIAALVIKDGGCHVSNTAVSYSAGGKGNLLEQLRGISCKGKSGPASGSEETVSELDPRPETFDWDGTYYSQLSAYEKKIYDTMYQAVRNNETTCRLKFVKHILNNEHVERALSAFVMDHPEFIGLDHGCTVYSNGWIRFETFAFWNEAKRRNDYTDKLTEKVREIAALAENEEDDFHKALFVYDYIGKTAHYDFDRLEEAQKEDGDPESELIYTAYGCLVDGGCVCSGYTAAIKLVLNELGIECYRVSGESCGESHAWNVVKMGDNWYHLDLTWDDDAFFGENGEELPNSVSFEYFGLTDEAISEDHTVDDEQFSIPECSADEFNYYRYFDLLIDEYSEEAVNEKLAKQMEMGRNPLVLKFTNRVAFMSGVSGGTFERLGKIVGEDYLYYVDHEHLSLMIITED